MALLEHQYSQARYYGGKYTFTGLSSAVSATLQANSHAISSVYNDVAPDPNDPNLALPGSYKLYVDGTFVSPTYQDVNNTVYNNYLIKFAPAPISVWYVDFDRQYYSGPAVAGATITLVFNQDDPNTRLGSYQFMPLSEIINNFMFTHVGEDKLIPKAQRTDVAFHAQRALAELSFDTLKS